MVRVPHAFDARDIEVAPQESMQAIAVVLHHVIVLVDRAEAVIGDKDKSPATGPKHAPNILRECVPPDDVLKDLGGNHDIEL